MNPKLKKIMLLKLTFVVFTIYVNIFINYFFWEKTGDLKSIILFNLIQWIFWMIPYSTGVFLLLKNPKVNYYISSVAAVGTFIFLWAFSESIPAIPLMIIIASMTTLTSAFFYASNTVALLNSATSSKEMNHFISLEGSLTNLLSLITPIINGAIIFYFGFNWSFIFMIFVSLFYFYLSLTATETDNVKWKDFKDSMKNDKFTSSMVSYNFIAIFASRGMLLFGSILLIFVSIDELQMSFLKSLSVIVIFLFALLIRKYPSISVLTWTKVNLVLLVLSSFVILFNFSFIYLIVLQAIITYLSRYIEMSLPLKVMRRSSGVGKIVLSYKREFIINNARIVMGIIWLVVYHYVSLETLFLLILGSSFVLIIVVAFIGSKIERDIK